VVRLARTTKLTADGLAALTARAVAPRMVARRAEGGCARASLMAGLLPEVPFLLWQIVTALIPS
jgi:hypothetical protein